MSQCPKCGAVFTDDEQFGLVPCESCGTLLSVGIDGLAQVAGEAPTGDSQKPPPPSQNDNPSPPVEQENSEGTNEWDNLQSSDPLEAEPSQDEEVKESSMLMDMLEQESQGNIDADAIDEQEDVENPTQNFDIDKTGAQYEQPDVENVEQPEPDQSPDSWDTPSGQESLENESAEPLPPDPEPRKMDDLGEIEEYGNSEIAQGTDGPFYFNVFIKGINTKELRNQLSEAITDKKFGWDGKEIMRNVRMGELRITRLNSVKASVLVQRLRSLPVTITWEQHAIYAPGEI